MLRRVCLLIIVVGFSGCSPESPRNGPFPATSRLKSLGKLPDSWAVTALDGKDIEMRELRGKVVFINRWATWCPPCVAEMPGIQALYESLKDSGIVFLIVSEEKSTKVKEFAKKKGWSLPIYLATEGVPPILDPGVVPVSYVVNRKGDIVFEMQGAMDWDTDEARKFLKSIP